ncbi:hypothetical protein OCGS_0040 [Oceaniovalibus guishaninsula JLT2003]|uniref:DUF4167 domain-containing protein n=1 Tax=Oceaniovalibus guishaninsula JLT2003 TaxID=1231392 RepID=K2HT62_9RHOB|nr:DUF4167 domain-containing protein [Oceaniovalibus guishaninsula]EKE45814.1 hypothetical protein OCGS_0040 [Oceaniovalibus guishaninsula JLT2003]
MRSSKSRSRSKSNRNRPSGNIVNRVFDSSGPEGKVRGTPQQIIDKYNQLTRDAQLSGDRVAAENFAQHAEHYTRMLAEAQREQDARQAQNQNQNQGGGQGQHQGQGQGDRPSGQDHSDQQDDDRRLRNDDRDRDADPSASNDRDDRPAAAEHRGGDGAETSPDGGRKPRRRRAPRDETPAGEVIDTRSGDDGGETNLVETPESRPARPRRSRKPRASQDGDAGGEVAETEADRAAE